MTNIPFYQQDSVLSIGALWVWAEEGVSDVCSLHIEHGSKGWHLVVAVGSEHVGVVRCASEEGAREAWWRLLQWQRQGVGVHELIGCVGKII